MKSTNPGTGSPWGMACWSPAPQNTTCHGHSPARPRQDVVCHTSRERPRGLAVANPLRKFRPRVLPQSEPSLLEPCRNRSGKGREDRQARCHSAPGDAPRYSETGRWHSHVHVGSGSQTLEMTQASVDGRRDKQNVIHPFGGTLLSHKKEQSWGTRYHVDEP